MAWVHTQSNALSSLILLPFHCNSRYLDIAWDAMVMTTEVGRVMAPKEVLILIPKTEYFPWHKWLCWYYWGSWNEKVVLDYPDGLRDNNVRTGSKKERVLKPRASKIAILKICWASAHFYLHLIPNFSLCEFWSQAELSSNFSFPVFCFVFTYKNMWLKQAI